MCHHSSFQTPGLVIDWEGMWFVEMIWASTEECRRTGYCGCLLELVFPRKDQSRGHPSHPHPYFDGGTWQLRPISQVFLCTFLHPSISANFQSLEYKEFHYGRKTKGLRDVPKINDGYGVAQSLKYIMNLKKSGIMIDVTKMPLGLVGLGGWWEVAWTVLEEPTFRTKAWSLGSWGGSRTHKLSTDLSLLFLCTIIFSCSTLDRQSIYHLPFHSYKYLQTYK